MNDSRAWKVATALALGLAYLLWRGKGTLAPASDALRKLGLPVPQLASPAALPETTTYGPPFAYTGDMTQGSLPGCNGCNTGTTISRWFGDAAEQAAYMSR